MELITRKRLDREIVVWTTRVSEAPQPSCLHFLLDETERARAARFRFAEDHMRFALGRSLARKALALCVDRNPETISLAITDRGQPFFPEDESLQFSIAHTHDIVALAFTANCRIGVDFEFIKESRDVPELARRILSEADFHRFQALSAEEVLTAFYRIWTRKEAYFKARGEGIGDGLKAVSVSFEGDTITPVFDARDATKSANWRIHQLDLFAGYRGALACNDPIRLVNCSPVRWEARVGSYPDLVASHEISGTSQ